jgi:hypothetical protein
MYIFPNTVYPGPNGRDSMILILARYLSEKKNEVIVVFGKRNSFLKKRLDEQNIEHIFYDEEEEFDYKSISGDDILVLFENYHGLKRFKRSKCRVLVWCILGPQIINWSNFDYKKVYKGKILRKKLDRSCLINLCKKNALVCMDGSTQGDVEAFIGKKMNIDIVPIPVISAENYYIRKNMKEGKISITYIGRGDVYWKVYPLKKILKDIKDINNHFILNIFTSERELYDEVLEPILPDNVELVYQIGYYGMRLRTKLCEVSDLNISMGTAALESAVLGIPTIIVDAVTTNLPDDYRYRWIYQAEKYSLGYFDLHELPQYEGYEMTDVVNTIMNKVERDCISGKCWEYVDMHHNIINTYMRLSRHEGYASMRDIVKYSPNMWY